MVASPFPDTVEHFWSLPTKKRWAFHRHYRFTLPVAAMLISLVGGAFGYFVFKFPGSIPVGCAAGLGIGFVAAVIERRSRPATTIVIAGNVLILDGPRVRWTWPLDQLIAIDAYETSRNVQHSRLAFFHRNGERRTAAIEHDAVDTVVDAFLDRTPWVTIGFADDTYYIPEGADAAAGLHALARTSFRMFCFSAMVFAILLVMITGLLLLMQLGSRNTTVLVSMLAVTSIVGILSAINAVMQLRGWQKLRQWAKTEVRVDSTATSRAPIDH